MKTGSETVNITTLIPGSNKQNGFEGLQDFNKDRSWQEWKLKGSK